MKGIIKNFIIGLILGIMLGTVAVCVVYYTTKENVNWIEYIENILLPNAVTALVTLGFIGIGVKPTIKTVVEAAARFISAAKAADESAERNAKNDEAIAESRKEFTEQSAANRKELTEQSAITAEKLAALETKLEGVERSEESIKQMLRLGFGNMDELVKKGSAKKIFKVGEKSNEGK